MPPVMCPQNQLHLQFPKSPPYVPRYQDSVFFLDARFFLGLSAASSPPSLVPGASGASSAPSFVPAVSPSGYRNRKWVYVSAGSLYSC
jgi:hypothetical protein